MKAKLIKVPEGYLLQELPKKGTGGAVCEGTLGSTYGEGDWKLSQKNCDEIFGVVDVEKIIEQNKQTLEDSRISSYDSFKIGFNKAMELNKDKLFTLEDIQDAMESMVGQELFYGETIDETKAMRFKYIESYLKVLKMQPTEIEVEIVMEDYLLLSNPPQHKPKLDSEGCIILKKHGN